MSFMDGLKNGGAASFGQGLNQGVSLVANVDQMRQQRREKEWARDLTLVKTYVDYAGTKGVTPETSATAINQANGLIQKWYPQMKLPQVTPQSIHDYAPILKQGSALIDNLEKDPSKFEFVIGEWGKLNAGWDAENLKKSELTDMEKTARANVHDTLKTMDTAHKQNTRLDKASIQGFSGSNLIAYRNQLARQMEIALPDELGGISAQITDIDSEIAARRGKNRGAPAPAPSAPVTGGKEYASPDDVKADFKAGTITKEAAMSILQGKFGMK